MLELYGICSFEFFKKVQLQYILSIGRSFYTGRGVAYHSSFVSRGGFGISVNNLCSII